MIILLHGEDTFRLREKLNKIVGEYQAKHKSGLNLSLFKEDELNFDRFRVAVEAVSMFDEKKLIVLQNIFNSKVFQEEFIGYVKKSRLKDNQEVIVVVRQEDKSPVTSLKRQANMIEEFKPLQDIELAAWIRQRVKLREASITRDAVGKLVGSVGNDLWRLNSEINKLASYKGGGVIEMQDVELFIWDKTNANIFAMLDAMARKDNKTALKLLYQHLDQGDNEFYLLTMIIYQLRNLIRLKDLVEREVPVQKMAKRVGLHPFVVKKTVSQLKNFNFEQLKNFYRRLLEVDLELKTGRIDPKLALSMLVVNI